MRFACPLDVRFGEVLLYENPHRKKGKVSAFLIAFLIYSNFACPQSLYEVILFTPSGYVVKRGVISLVIRVNYASHQ